MPSTEGIAAAVLDALHRNRQREPFTLDWPAFSPRDAYAVSAQLRRLRTARGSAQIGRKIGFTNRSIWSEYGVHQPIWGDMYDDSVRTIEPGQQVAVSHLPEPRIEPEIVLRLGADLRPGMSLGQICSSIRDFAHGFEIVQSIYPGWRFSGADCIANGGLHGMLLLGPWQKVTTTDRAGLARALSAVRLTLFRNDEPVDEGVGANALDGPIAALTHLVDVLGTDAENPPLRAGEIVTTGTVTRAFPIKPGEHWSTRVEGLGLAGLAIEVA